MASVMRSIVAWQQPVAAALIGMMVWLSIAQATRRVRTVLRDMAVTEAVEAEAKSAGTLPRLEGGGGAWARAGFFNFFSRVTSCHSSRSRREGEAQQATSMKEERGRPSTHSMTALDDRGSRGAFPLPLDGGGCSEPADEEEEGLYNSQEGTSSTVRDELEPTEWKGRASGLRPGAGVVAVGKAEASPA
jgi:hypothetical protein